MRTDRIKLDRVITNLVTNAIKFTIDGGVTLSVALAADGAALIRVRDSGIGIAEHELERVFDEFSQMDDQLGNPDSGWGLGLAICRRLATFIGASISVESKLGRGTVFTVQLPSEYVVDITPVGFSDASSTVGRADDLVAFRAGILPLHKS